jgi:phospholipid transport system transporter-binding protein
MPQRLTMDTAAQALEALAPAAGAAAGDPLVVDLEPVQDFDSAALALLIELGRRRRIEVRNAPPNLRKLAALYGVDELLLGRR